MWLHLIGNSRILAKEIADGDRGKMITSFIRRLFGKGLLLRQPRAVRVTSECWFTLNTLAFRLLEESPLIELPQE